MYILLYIMTLLMLLATITYVSLERFRSAAALDVSFVHYMQHTERAPINHGFKSLYGLITAGENEPHFKATPVPGISKLNLFPMLHPDFRQKHEELSREVQELFKQLIRQLYQHQDFYRDIERKRPHFLNELVQEMQQATDRLSENPNLLRSPQLLQKLLLLDPELHHFLYLALQGKIVETKTTEKTTQPDEEEDEEEPLEAVEVHPDPGYTSILDYITIKPKQSQYPLRVFLAAPPLLQAIYEDPRIVEEILALRNALLKEIKRDKESQAVRDSASHTFETYCSTRGHAANYPNTLNFKASNTTPKK